MALTAIRNNELAGLPDSELVELVRRKHRHAFATIMQRHNRRLFRVARSVLRDDAEAEDVVQETYVRAFTALASFRQDAALSTWLTRIALNEAMARLRKRRPSADLDALDTPEERRRMQVIPFPAIKNDSDPEQAATRNEIRRVLERAIDDLPEHFRIVFVMRDIEEMSVEETAANLSLRPETVRTRLHRARAQLRRALTSQLASTLTEAFPFAGARCARICASVLAHFDDLNASIHNQEKGS